MYYQIPLKKLQKIIAKPLYWEDGSNKSLLEAGHVQKNIEEGNVFIESSDSEAQKIEKHAAFLSINHLEQLQAIELDLGDSTGTPEKIFQTWQSAAQWLACEQLKKDSVICKIQAPGEIVKALLGSQAQSIENPFEHAEPHVDFKINWNIAENSLANRWDEQEYVIKKLRASSGEDWGKIFPMIPQQHLDKPEFFEELFTPEFAYLRNHRHLPKEVLGSPAFLQFCLKDHKELINSWEYFEDHFVKVLEMLHATPIEKEVDFHAPMNYLHLIDESQFKDFQQDYETITAESQRLSLHIVKSLFEHHLSDVSKSRELLERMEWKSSSYSDPFLLPHLFSKEVQTHPDFVQAILQLHDKKARGKYDSAYDSSLGLSKVFHPEVFKDKEQSFKLFLQEYPKFFCQKDLPPHITTHFSNDYESALKLLTIGQEKRLATHINEYLSKELLNNENFFKDMIKIGCTHFSVGAKQYKSWFAKPEIKQLILDTGNYTVYSALPSSVIFSLNLEKDKKHICQLVKINKDLLSQKETPKEWRSDIDVVAGACVQLHWFKPSKTEMKNLASTVENAIRLVESNDEFYHVLPDTMKQNPEVAENFLRAKGNDSYYYQKISPTLWLNREFCLKVVGMNSNINSKIPVQFWSDPTFMKGFFKRMDDDNDVLCTLDNIPSVVKQTLDSFDLKKGDFMKFGESFVIQQQLKKDFSTQTEQPKNVVRKNKI